LRKTEKRKKECAIEMSERSMTEGKLDYSFAECVPQKHQDFTPQYASRGTTLFKNRVWHMVTSHKTLVLAITLI
jgi:hypothetical protein